MFGESLDGIPFGKAFCCTSGDIFSAITGSSAISFGEPSDGSDSFDMHIGKTSCCTSGEHFTGDVSSSCTRPSTLLVVEPSNGSDSFSMSICETSCCNSGEDSTGDASSAFTGSSTVSFVDTSQILGIFIDEASCCVSFSTMTHGSSIILSAGLYSLMCGISGIRRISS